jgi:tetratricopeptide (TPR) repeat protein
MPPTARCLDENAVLDLFERRAPIADVEEHLDGCAACRRLLTRAARGYVPLGQTVSLGAAPKPVPALTLQRGSSVARYVILGVVGRGGMGVVYAAYDPDLDRKVALKLVRPSARGAPGGGELRARLLREAQTMARLSHPHVIAVHDAGTLGEDVFIAMEFVEGRTLAAWLRERPRRWREVLDVFLKAGAGLAAAHAAGVVHRDFKPDNVLVGWDERVRVTDFGLARTGAAAPGGVAGKPSPDEGSSGALQGTPAYMAPEQLQGLPADTRADVFGFCVALWEALYGMRPFGGSTISELRASVLAGRPAEPGRAPGVPAWVRRVLLRGLRSAPEERFGSMEALAGALSRDPGRRWRRTGAAVLGLAALAGGLWGYARWLEEKQGVCRGAEARLAGVWDAARRETVAAAFRRTGRAFAEDALRGATIALDAWTSRWTAMRTEACEATRIRGEQSEELLDLRMLCLDQRARDLAALTDLFARADSRIVEKAVEAARVLPDLGVCADAEALRARRPLPKDRATAERAEAVFADLSRARVLLAAGKARESLPLARSAAEAARTLGYEPARAAALVRLGESERGAGDYAAAERDLAEGFFAAQAIRDDETAALAAVDLVWVVGGKLARYADAHAWNRHAGAAVRRIGSPPRLEMNRLAHIGAVLRREGRLAEAALHQRRALVIGEQAFGRNDPQNADALNNLAVVVLDQGDYAAGRELLRRAMVLHEKAHGPEHPLLTNVAFNLAQVLNYLGHTLEALALQRRVLATRGRLLGPGHPDVAKTHYTVGLSLHSLGRYDQAMAHYRTSLEALERALGRDHVVVSGPLHYMAVTLRAQGRYEEALAHERRALAIRERRAGPNHGTTGISRGALARIHLRRGEHGRARAEASLALQILEKATGPAHSTLVHPLLTLAQVARLTGAPSEGRALVERALAIAQNAFGVAHESVAQVLTEIAENRLALGDPRGAVEPAVRAVATAQPLSIAPRFLARARFVLARALWASRGDRARAETLTEEAEKGFADAKTRDRSELEAVRRWRAGRR